MKPCLHFVGFRDPTRYANAVRVFGEPDFVHDEWDVRAYEDFMPSIDTMVIADIAHHPRRLIPRTGVAAITW